MLSKQNRVSRKLFKEVFEKGTTYGGNFFHIKVFKIPINESRYAFSVSKKVSKNAVIRNLLKRRARHVIRDEIEKIKKGYGVVFFFNKKEILDVSFENLKEEIKKILQKAKLC